MTRKRTDVDALLKHVVQIGRVPGPREVVFLADGALPYVADWAWLRVALNEVLGVKLPASVRRKVERILDAPRSRRTLPLLPVIVHSGGRFTVHAVDLARSCPPPQLRATLQPNPKTRAAMKELERGGLRSAKDVPSLLAELNADEVIDAPPRRPIRSQADYERGLLDIKRLLHARPGTKKADELEAIGALVEAYEERVYPVPNPDPIEAIKFRMEQQGLTSVDLLPIFGTRRRISEVLNRRRPLTLDMIRQLHYRLGIPLQSLVAPPGARSIGSGNSGIRDLSERVDEFLADGFGQPGEPDAPCDSAGESARPKRRLRQKGART